MPQSGECSQAPWTPPAGTGEETCEQDRRGGRKPNGEEAIGEENMKKKTKMIVSGVLAALVVAAGVKFALPSLAANEQQPAAAYIELKKRDMVNSIDTSGKLSSVNSRSVSAASDRIVKAVYVKVGDKVRAGQTLAQLDVSGARQELEQFRANLRTELDTAERELAEKKKEYELAKFSFDIGDGSKQNMEKAQRAYENAAAELESKKNKPGDASLQKQIADGTITAPISGTVTAVSAEEGSMSSGSLFTIEDTENLQVTATVSEYDVNAVKPGMKAVVKTEMTGEQEFQGEVLSVSPAAQKNTGDKNASGKVLFQVNVGLTNESDQVRIGGNAQVKLIAEKKEGIFTVPFDALVNAADGGSIYIAEPQGDSFAVREIRVTTGMQNDVETEISGAELKEGMKILRNPAGLTPGMKVNLLDGAGASLGMGAGADDGADAGQAGADAVTQEGAIRE